MGRRRVPLIHADIVCEYLSGATLVAIANDNECSAKAIRARLLMLNVTLRGRQPVMTDADVEQAKSMYVVERKSTHDIARGMGFSIPTVRDALIIRAKVTLRSPGEAISLAWKSGKMVNCCRGTRRN